MKTIIETHNVVKIFNKGEHTEVRAVRGIDIILKEGEIVMIMGPSGSGKTTLLTMIGGLSRPSTGTIIFNSKEINAFTNEKLAKLRRHYIGYIFQSFNLLENLSALENVIVAGFQVAKKKEQASLLLEKLGLGKRMLTKPRDLSGGERQRVAIARALINNPLLILGDEPTANLDRATGREVMTHLCSIGCEQGKSIIVVSHDERIKDIAHRVLYMEDGSLVREEKGRHEEVCTMKKHRLGI